MNLLNEISRPVARDETGGMLTSVDADMSDLPIGDPRVTPGWDRRSAIKADAGLRSAYETARRVRLAVRPVMTVEVTAVCNLFCEGCCYFHDDFEAKPESDDLSIWREFFTAEWERGKRYAVFHGAEPALKQDRLMAAAETFSRGIVYTNGTIRMHDDIPFVPNVSIWGDEESTEKVRGGSTYRKALRNFENNPRARFSIVVNAQNYRQIPTIVADLAAAGVAATVSYFSPSHGYLEKLEARAPNDNRFYRFSKTNDQMVLTSEQFAEVDDMIRELAERHPRTLLQGAEYNRWLTAPGSRYVLDEHGVANECAVRKRSAHDLYGVDLKPVEAKCALPDTDCANCRILPVSTTSILHNSRLYGRSRESFEFWIEAALQAGRLFLRDDDSEVWGDSPPPMSGWRTHFGVQSD